MKFKKIIYIYKFIKIIILISYMNKSESTTEEINLGCNAIL
jgi:hypothetical protein